MKAKKKLKRDKNKNGVDDRLDTLATVVSVALPFTTLDQLRLIYFERHVEGVSALTWFLYGVLSLPLVVYAWQRRDLPMILLNGLWVFVDFLVWFGVIIYAV